jgi:hypothetical protein
MRMDFTLRDLERSVEAAVEPNTSPPKGWDQHLPLLPREHPEWDFAAGYRER